MSDDQYLLPECKPRWWQRVPLDRWIALGSAVVALGSVLFSGLQYRATHEQAEVARAGLELAKQSAQDQARDVERSRAAAERSANASEGNREAAQKSAALAQAQLENSINLFHIDQRARLDVISVSRETDFELGKPIRFRATVRNIGKTHALRFKGQEWILAAPTFKAEYPDDGNVEQSLKDLAPGAGSGYDVDITLSQPYFDAIKEGAMRIWVYGKASYYDIFDTKILHELKWCYYYPSHLKSVPEIRELEICSQHNNSN